MSTSRPQIRRPRALVAATALAVTFTVTLAAVVPLSSNGAQTGEPPNPAAADLVPVLIGTVRGSNADAVVNVLLFPAITPANSRPGMVVHTAQLAPAPVAKDRTFPGRTRVRRRHRRAGRRCRRAS